MKHFVVPLALLAAGIMSQPRAQGFDPPDATDIDPSPNVVEVNLVAGVTTWQLSPGVDTAVYAYGDDPTGTHPTFSIPGPTIRAKVGDTLKVHFKNMLPEPTTIHWHGVELPAAMDGSHISQLTVQPGATFDYEYTLLKGSLYWYHPHVNTYFQVEQGLYGTMVVRDPIEDQVGLTDPSKVDEHVIVFDDVLLDPQGQMVPPFPYANGVDPVKHAEYQLNGRLGNLLLVNGRAATTMTLPLPAGKAQRWRVVNAANSTICRLDVQDPVTGLTCKLFEIGNDSGLEEKPFERVTPMTSTAPPAIDHPGRALLSQMGEGILLLPGERLDLFFTPTGHAGDMFVVQQNDWYRGRHVVTVDPLGNLVVGADPMDGRYPDQPYFSMVLTGDNAVQLRPPATMATFPPQPGPVTGVLPMTFGHSMPDAQGNITLFAQAEMVGGQMVPLPTAKITSFKAHDAYVGDTMMWEVTNLTAGDHPFHTHGFFFELLEYEFQDMDNPTNNFFFRPYARRLIKDTIRVPPRLGSLGRSKTITRLLVHFDDTGREGQVTAQGELPTFYRDGHYSSGGWLVHCHVLEHSGRGMLSYFEVRDRNDPFQLLGRFLPGTYGNPSLTGRPAGQYLDLDLVDALPHAPVYLLLGTQAMNTPLLGGTLVPGGSVAVLAGNVNGMGMGQWHLPGWQSVPTGSQIYWQAGFADAGATQGFALSNAMLWTAP